LFPVVTFLKYVGTKVVLFLLMLLRHWHFTGQCSETPEVWLVL